MYFRHPLQKQEWTGRLTYLNCYDISSAENLSQRTTTTFALSQILAKFKYYIKLR